jgi:putative tryptophan/tyrosine transport system substrate-binding protein
MKRRQFITLLGGAAAAWPFAARAQQSSNKIPVVGALWHAGSAEEEDVYLSVLVKAFHDLGYDEGRNIHFDHRFPNENPDRFQTLARELVDEKPDVIIDVLVRGAVELKKLTDTIPIVFVIVADPVGYGLVKSLARPDSISLMTTDLSGKRLEILKEAVPKLSQVALLLDPTVVGKEKVIRANEVAAQALGLSLQVIEIAAPDEIESTFSNMVRDGVNGVAIGPTGLLFNQRARLGAAALRYKLPIMSHIAEEVPYGQLFSYGPDFPDFFRRAARYADKILKGAKPADLPVEQPTKFKLVLNLKTAKALGLTIPQTLIVSADEVIGA